MTYEDTNIWRKAFNPSRRASSPQARQRLTVALANFRNKANQLSQEIPRDIQQLTDHSIEHLDALWEFADILLGNSVDLNPAEAFVFGGAVLLHDLANTVAAFPRGIEDLYGDKWNDLVHAAYLKAFDRRPTPEECRKPHESLYSDILLKRLRQAHAQQAETLATQGFYRQNGTGERIHLLDDEELRHDLGALIGRIAYSHHWPIQQVVKEFRNKPGTSPALPREWSIDALKVACLLRAADAAHLDRRRAPSLTYAVRQRQLPADSEKHWRFQSLLLRPEVNHEQLQFTSSRPFKREEREAWWLCHDTLRMVDQELRGIDEVLRTERSYRFAARSVAGVGSPESLAALIKTSGWEPVDIRVRITDVANVIERFGGASLYGDNPLFALRELIANAADAIRARRVLQKRDADFGRIKIRLGKEEHAWWLEVEDDGIGMSEAVLRGPLLDFGMSYWNSDLVMKDQPGLLSSDFAPTGKFGIGFFSVFMLGDKVRVTTRLYDDKRDSGRILELSHQGDAHPFIRRLDVSQEVPDGGTCIRVWLKEPPYEGLFLTNFDSNRTEPRKLLDALSKAVAHTAPTLDVSIDCIIVGATQHKCTSVEANDWETLPFDALVKRLDPKWYMHPLDIGTPGEIRRNGHLIARLQIHPSRGTLNHAGWLTVRGLSTLTPAGDYHGVMLAENPNLSRTEARPLVSVDEVRSFIDRHPLKKSDLNKMDWEQRLTMAHLLLDFGLDPTHIPCFILHNKHCTLKEVETWLKGVSPGQAIRILHEGYCELQDTDEFSESRLMPAHILNDWNQPEDLVVTGQPLYNHELLPDFPPLRRRRFGQQEHSYPGFTNPLAALIVEAAARIWNTDAANLTKLETNSQKKIGDLYGRPLVADSITTLKRPKQKKQKVRSTLK